MRLFKIAALLLTLISVPAISPAQTPLRWNDAKRLRIAARIDAATYAPEGLKDEARLGTTVAWGLVKKLAWVNGVSYGFGNHLGEARSVLRMRVSEGSAASLAVDGGFVWHGSDAWGRRTEPCGALVFAQPLGKGFSLGAVGQREFNSGVWDGYACITKTLKGNK